MKLNAVLLFTLALCTIGQALPTDNLLPILLVHGFSGVQIEAKLNRKHTPHFYCSKVRDWEVVWFSLKEELLRGCLADELKMIYDKEQNRMVDQEGVTARPVGSWNSTNSIEVLDNFFPAVSSYFREVVDVLKNVHGYEEGKTLFAPKYDFRSLGDERNMKQYFAEVTRLIEDVYSSTKKPVILVSHSMGGPLMSRLLSTKTAEWKNQYIDSWYSISGALGGSFSSVLNGITGRSYGPSSLISQLFGSQMMVSSFSSLYYMFPSPSLYKNDQVMLEIDGKHYTAKNMTQIVAHISPDMLNVLPYIPDPFVTTPPGVHMNCVYGVGVDTPVKAHFDGNFSSDKCDVTYGKGDGVVDTEALRSCQLWNNGNGKPVVVKEFANLEHLKIMKDPEFLAHLKNFIRSRNGAVGTKVVIERQ